MYRILIRSTIKDYQNTKDAKVRSRYGMFCGILGIATNFLISGMKIIAGLLSGSLAIIADGINSLMDGASSFVTLIAFHMSSAPADREHPFGHERLEQISGLIVSIVILIVGAFLAESSIRKILSPVPIETESFWLLATLLIISILIKLWQGTVYSRVGDTIESQALKASSFDSWSDIASTSAVLLAMILQNFVGWNLDGYFGLAVSVFIIISGIKLIKETVSPLLGEAPNEEMVKMIRSKLMSYEGILGFHDLVIHTYGASQVYVTVHLEVDASVDVLISHDIIDAIEQDFMKEANINLLVHLDPVNINDKSRKKLKSKVATILETIDPRLHFHDFRVGGSVDCKTLVFHVVVPHGIVMSDQELNQKILSEIHKINANYQVEIVFDHHYVE